MHLVEYMAWVPIVGSAFGNVLGGFVSDYFIGKNHKQATDNAEKEGLLAQLISSPTAAEDTGFDHDHSSKQGNKGLHSPRHNSPSAGQSNSGGCGGDSDDSSGSGADAGMPVDQSLRMLIAGVSNLLPAPLIVCALLADFPYCFLIMIVSGMVRKFIFLFLLFFCLLSFLNFFCSRYNFFFL